MMTVSIRFWILPLAIILVCAAIVCTGDAGRAVLRYLGPNISSAHVFNFGDVSYRWLSGHFTHIGWRHLGLNVFGLISIWALYGGVMRIRGWLVFFLMCPVGISLSLSLLSPETAYYVGFSGVLHGALGAAATMRLLLPSRDEPQTFTHPRRWEEIIVLAGLWGKIAYEQVVGAVPMTAAISGDAVVIDAHLYGVIIGIGFAAAVYCYLFVKCKICKYINRPSSG